MLLLDLDETLIYATKLYKPMADTTIIINEDQ